MMSLKNYIVILIFMLARFWKFNRLEANSEFWNIFYFTSKKVFNWLILIISNPCFWILIRLRNLHDLWRWIMISIFIVISIIWLRSSRGLNWNHFIIWFIFLLKYILFNFCFYFLNILLWINQFFALWFILCALYNIIFWSILIIAIFWVFLF